MSWKLSSNRQLYRWILRVPCLLFSGASCITKSHCGSVAAEESPFLALLQLIPKGSNSSFCPRGASFFSASVPLML